MTKGYNNRIAIVDLTSREVEYSTFAETGLEQWLGGRGLGAALISKHSKTTAPLSPESFLYFGIGPLTGSGFPLSNRLTFVFKSPLTGTIAWANTGGYAGAEMKSAGFDAIMLHGRSENPVYLLTGGSKISIVDAASVWGRGAIESVVKFRQLHGDVRVLSIGPAGERLVKLANVVNDTGRTSGVRHGVGAVMGSKNLKAIIIKGDPTRRVEIFDRPSHLELLKQTLAKIRDSSLLNHDTGLLAVHGTPVAAELLGKNDALPVKNYQSTTLENHFAVGALMMTKTVLISRLTCANCPVGCRRETASAGKYSFRVEGPDYAQISSLGTSCFVTDLEAIGYMNYLCYDYGLDPIEVGNELAILAELTEKCAVKQGLRWGDEGRMIELIRQTAYLEGVGGELALGPDEFAGSHGHPEVSMTVKGITIQNTDPRAEAAWGLLNATENFGAGEHIWVHADLIQSFKDTGLRTLVGLHSTPREIAAAVKYKQDFVALLDSLQVCAFSSFVLSPDDYAKELHNVTGTQMTGEDLLEVGERVFTLERKFNADNGITRSADTLPKRFLEEPIPSGLHKGAVCNLGPMIREYHAIRG